MVGPGVPRKLAFAQCVGVSRINSSRCFASRSCRSPARPDRTASAPTFCKIHMRIRRAASSDMAHSAACSNSASQVSPICVGLMRRLPTSSCPFPFPIKPLTLFYIICTLPVVDLPHLLAHARVIFYVQWPDHF